MNEISSFSRSSSQLRSGNEEIPGCIGVPVRGEDYCRYPDPTAPPTPEPTGAVTPPPTPEPTAAVTAPPTPEPTEAVTPPPTPEPTAAVTPPPTPEPTEAPLTLQLIYNQTSAPPNRTLLECQGDCDDDTHCDGDLVCFQRYVNTYIQRISFSFLHHDAWNSHLTMCLFFHTTSPSHFEYTDLATNQYLVARESQLLCIEKTSALVVQQRILYG